MEFQNVGQMRSDLLCVLTPVKVKKSYSIRPSSLHNVIVVHKVYYSVNVLVYLTNIALKCLLD